MPLELMPTRLERFVELRRSVAWLSTPILWPAKDIPAMEPTQSRVEMDNNNNNNNNNNSSSSSSSSNLGNEVFSSMPRISLGDDSGTEEDGSGVKWRYAAQGSQLHEASSRNRGDAAFARKSYIDGVVYMLKALPDDMDELETAAVRRAATASCRDQGNGGSCQVTAYPQRLSYRPSGDQEKTLLHRSVQGLVATLVLLAHLLFCLFKEGVRIGARYERQYNISQILVEGGFVVASAVGKYGVVLKTRIDAISDSRSGHAVGALSAWALENVMAGVQDGLGEGMQMIHKQQ